MVLYLTHEDDKLIRRSKMINNYSLLGRLQCDLDYWLGNGNQCDKHLYYGNIGDHYAAMKELHANMKQKPEWLTDEQLQEYSKKIEQAKN